MDPFTIYLFLLYLLCVVGVVVMAVVVMVGDCSQFHYTSPSFLAETYMILPPPKKIVPSIIHPSLVFIRKLVYLCYCWPIVDVVVSSLIQHIISSILCVFRVFLSMLYIFAQCVMLSVSSYLTYLTLDMDFFSLNGLIRIFLMCAPAKEVSSGMRVCVSICFDNNASHKKMNQFLFSVAVCMLAVSNCRWPLKSIILSLVFLFS